MLKLRLQLIYGKIAKTRNSWGLNSPFQSFSAGYHRFCVCVWGGGGLAGSDFFLGADFSNPGLEVKPT
jgi:hypothetical protein